jgi:hypothetical protein
VPFDSLLLLLMLLPCTYNTTAGSWSYKLRLWQGQRCPAAPSSYAPCPGWRHSHPPLASVWLQRWRRPLFLAACCCWHRWSRQRRSVLWMWGQQQMMTQQLAASVRSGES